MTPIVVIPARLASTRLPGKPLARIGDAPMIVQVWRRAVAADVGPVAVACAEREIAAAIEAEGGRAILTRPDHPSGSDRVFEALGALDPAGHHDVVVNLQGDLPLIDPKAIRAALVPLADPAVDIATLAAPIRDPREIDEASVVKIAAAFPPGAGVARLPPAALELRERLEQLRALEAGLHIAVALVDTVPLGVDTPDDLARARALFVSATP